MSMSILVLTTDSDTQLPSISTWNNKMGRGVPINSNQEIITLLKKCNLNLPTDDLEKEVQYKDVLKDYLREARLMFSGLYTEVRLFCDEIKEFGDVDLYIISGRYGLINEKDIILPYYSPIINKKNISKINKNNIVELDLKTSFVKEIIKISPKYDIIIFVLPSPIFEFLIEKDSFCHNAKKITLCSKNLNEYAEKNNFVVFNRPGVARIGKDNREKIIGLLEEYSRE